MTERLDAEEILREAVGEADLGEDTWREGYDRVVHSLRTESDLSEIGVEVVRAELVGYLATRAGVLAWAAEHPEETSGPVSRPLVIVGQPRTGTTILFDLLAQDPARGGGRGGGGGWGGAGGGGLLVSAPRARPLDLP
jgi:hypothetical protein